VNDTAAAKGPPQRACELGAYVVGVSYDVRAATLAVATGAGKIVLLDADPRIGTDPREVAVHRGASLSFARDPAGTAFVSGGDDGRVVRVDVDGGTGELFDARGKWIECLATHAARKLVAFGAGRNVHLLAEAGSHVLGPHPSTVTDVSFSPDGTRLAVTHYGGVSIHLTAKPGDKPKTLAWKGSHLAARYSPNAKFLATATQENAIHVWRLASGADMQMQGYATKVKSIAWTSDGNWLLSSGAELCVCWGFAGKGPEGQPPMELTPPETAAVVTRVAAHPAAPFVLLGFGDGTVQIADIAKKRVTPLAPATGSPVSALDWAPDGWHLAAGTEAGTLRLFDLKPRA
jgi:WD40 repeat protein